MQKPMMSKSSQFIERWSTAEFVNSRLGAMLMVMSFCFLILTGTLIYITTKPRPIYYVPGVISAGVAYSQNTPKTTAGMFSSSWLLNWTNFTPASVEDVYKRAQRFMSPRLLSQTRTRLKKDIQQVKENNIASLFSLNQDPQVHEDSKGFDVIIKGDKGVYMGKEEIKLQKTVYRIRLRQTPPTDFNPYGLIIDDINQEVME